MKKYVLLTYGLVCAAGIYAQTKQGTIVYERKIDVHRHMQDEQMKAMVPQFQTANYDLVFKDSITVYKAAPKDDAPDPFDNGGGGGAHIVMRFNGPGDDGVLYKNFGSNQQLQESTLDDKKYIVTDSIKQPQWKLADETQTILNHVCKKATTTTERGSNVVAWYTEDIQVPAGPDRFCGLPGAILKIDIDSGSVVFTATDIQPKADTKDLKAPTSGKLITQADFQKKMDEVLGPADSKGKRIITKQN
ncbi:MAG TPA: GLPGLI family protein [Chitinophagaceae bacterium]|nr:GLPGLI family protein [Chitinophagaceae bacterium]